MSRPSKPQRGRKKPFQRLHARPQVEALEDRAMPSTTAISGYVFADANNNGLFDNGEKPIASNQIQLLNSSNQVVGTTTTDAQGFYQFTSDQTLPGTPAVLTQTITIPATET